MKMPPRIHQEVRRNLGIQLYNYVDGKVCEGYCVSLTVRPFMRETIVYRKWTRWWSRTSQWCAIPAKLDDIGCSSTWLFELT